jgi:hypothetical protein
MPSELFGTRSTAFTFRDLPQEGATFNQQLFHLEKLTHAANLEEDYDFHIQPDNVSKLTIQDERDIVGPYTKHLNAAYSDYGNSSHSDSGDFVSEYYNDKDDRKSDKIAKITYSSKESQRVLITLQEIDRFIDAARTTSEKCGPTLVGALIKNKYEPADQKTIIYRIDLQNAK